MPLLDMSERMHHRRASTVAFADATPFPSDADLASHQTAFAMAAQVFVQPPVQEDAFLVRSNPVAHLPVSEPVSSSREGLSTALLSSGEQPEQVADTGPNLSLESAAQIRDSSVQLSQRGSLQKAQTAGTPAVLGRPFVGSGSI